MSRQTPGMPNSGISRAKNIGEERGVRISAGYLFGIAFLALASCNAPPATNPTSSSTLATAAPSSQAARVRVSAAINAIPTALSSNLTLSQPGTTEFDALVHGGLAVPDGQGVLRPQLAQSVPSVDNGDWKLNPDG